MIEQDFPTVSNFEDLTSVSFQGENNAVCWERQLKGDFAEIIEKVPFEGNILELRKEILQNLHLSEQGQLAREILLNDMKLLSDFGAQPVLNIIKSYERDENSFFPTDVYSFHIDTSPIPLDTFLCTYSGASSEILPNSQALQKIHDTEIRKGLKKQFDKLGLEGSFDAFLEEYFYDIHYQPLANVQPISCGNGNLWRLSTGYPESKSLPCVHRAPKESDGKKRLLLIC